MDSQLYPRSSVQDINLRLYWIKEPVRKQTWSYVPLLFLHLTPTFPLSVMVPLIRSQGALLFWPRAVALSLPAV